jgi:hypothetical protein
VIQASAPPRIAPGARVSGFRRILSNYQRHLVWDIECGFRDTKDLRFGMGMASIRVSTPARRDRLWLLNALAVALLTLLGAAGEALGYDRLLKSNTTKRRTHSLFRQGAMLYDLMPNMPEQRLAPLVERFAAMLTEQRVFADTFGAV